MDIHSTPEEVIKKLQDKEIVQKYFSISFEPEDDIKGIKYVGTISKKSSRQIIGWIHANDDEKSELKKFKWIVKPISNNKTRFYFILYETQSVENIANYKRINIPLTNVNFNNTQFNDFTHKLKLQIPNIIKPNYKVSAMTVITLVAIIVSVGMNSLFSDMDPETKTVVLSESELLNKLGDNAKENKEYKDAQYYYTNSAQMNPGNTKSIADAREVYSLASGYSNIFPHASSLITIDSEGVMIYPDKEKGFVIPIKHDSISLDYFGNIPVLYSVGEEYPTVFFDIIDPTKAPIIISPNDPNLTSMLNNAKDKIVVQPVYRESFGNIIQYAETINHDGSLVIYPYGFGDDVPVLVFPDVESYPIIVKSDPGNVQNYLVSGTTINVTPSDLISIQYTEVNLDDIQNIPNNIPVRVIGNSNNVPIDFPLGLDNRPIISYGQDKTGPLTTAKTIPVILQSTIASKSVTLVQVSASASVHGSSFSGKSFSGVSGSGVAISGSSIGLHVVSVMAPALSVGSVGVESGNSVPIAASVGEKIGELFALEDIKKNSVTVSSTGPSSYGSREGLLSYESSYGTGVIEVGALTVVSSIDSAGYFGSNSGATAAPESPIGSIALVASMLSVLVIFSTKIHKR